MSLVLNTLRSRLIALVMLSCLLMAIVFAAAVHIAHKSYYEELRQQQGLVFARSVVALYPELFSMPMQMRSRVEERFEEMDDEECGCGCGCGCEDCEDEAKEEKE